MKRSAGIFVPVTLGTLADVASWRGVFCLLLALGLVLMVCSMCLQETLPVEARTRRKVLYAYANLLNVFRNPRFFLAMLAVMTMHFAFFAYISASPFIFQQGYGLSPFAFSLCFGLNAVMIVVGAWLATRFRSQAGAVRTAGISFMAAAVFVSACQVLHAPLGLLMAGYIWMLLSFGLLQPVATAVALDAERDNAGAASAVFGASIFIAGALACLVLTLRLGRCTTP